MKITISAAIAQEFGEAKRWFRDTVIRLESRLFRTRSDHDATTPGGIVARDLDAEMMTDADRARSLRFVRGEDRRQDIARHLESVRRERTPHEWIVVSANDVPRAASPSESMKARAKVYSTPADRLAAEASEYRTIQ